MYKVICLLLLLPGYISMQNITPDVSPGITNANVTATTAATKLLSEGGKETRPQIKHSFSEPVIIVIILVVMASIIGIILLIAFLYVCLRKKSSLDRQLPFSNDTGVPLSSVEAGNPEK